MSSVKVLKTLGVGRGITMDITVDEAKPEDSIYRYAMDTICNGDEAVYIPPHWHKDHAEHLEVIEGRMNVAINGDSVLLKAGDPPVLVPRRAVHTLKGFKGERLVFRERPDPAGMYKAMYPVDMSAHHLWYRGRFFNDAFSTGKFGGFWHVLRVFYDWETYLALPLYFRFFDEIFITIFGGIAHLFAPPKPEKL